MEHASYSDVIRFYYLCPDYAEPSGGTKQIYRHVDVLRRQGLEAFVLHSAEGFRCSWFENTTPVAYTARTQVRGCDYLVVPEVYGQRIADMAPGGRKVIFNQNVYRTFLQKTDADPSAPSPYLSDDVKAILVNSEDGERYLAYAFPQKRIFKIRCGIDRAVFKFSSEKTPQLALMPRRLPEDAMQVIKLLTLRGALEGFSVAAIDGQSEKDTARILGESLIFLSFSQREGFGLPPAEAMMCGCLVAGYTGMGGNEYFDPDFSYPVRDGDVLSFAKTVEELLLEWRRSPQPLQAKGAAASEFIGANYSLEGEEQDIISAFRSKACATA